MYRQSTDTRCKLVSRPTIEHLKYLRVVWLVGLGLADTLCLWNHRLRHQLPIVFSTSVSLAFEQMFRRDMALELDLLHFHEPQLLCVPEQLVPVPVHVHVPAPAPAPEPVPVPVPELVFVPVPELVSVPVSLAAL